MSQQETSSYKQIAKSTGIFGGSQFLNIAIGILRTKVLAVLLGSTGVGFVGMFQSIIDLVRSVSSFGLSFSSVKDIAEASQTQDEKRISESVFVLHRWVWWTGTFGMLVMILFSAPLSQYVFKDTQHVWPICLLSFSVLAATISSGQLALLQGMRQIVGMAKASLYGALIGSMVAILLYLMLGVDGIVPALLSISVISLFFSWWFARKIRTQKVSLSVREVFHRGGGMIRLGLYTVLSGLFSTLTLFLMKGFILQKEGIESVGLFQSVWSITNMYIGTILTSMGADYFPRLCGFNQNPAQQVRFTNEQTRFVLIVSTPLIVLMLFAASPVLTIFYASDFAQASGLLSWQIVGAFLKILVWPIGFILLAQGKGLRFLLVELTWCVVYYLLTCFGWPYLGLNAAGVGFVLAYVVYLPLVYWMIRPLCRFSYNRRNLYLILGFTGLVAAAFCVTLFLHGWLMYLTAIVLLVACFGWSAYEFNQILPASLWLGKIKDRFKPNKN